jgi:hypothetical protein
MENLASPDAARGGAAHAASSNEGAAAENCRNYTRAG